MGHGDTAGHGEVCSTARDIECLLTVGSTSLKQRWTLLPHAVDHERIC